MGALEHMHRVRSHDAHMGRGAVRGRGSDLPNQLFPLSSCVNFVYSLLLKDSKEI